MNMIIEIKNSIFGGPIGLIQGYTQLPAICRLLSNCMSIEINDSTFGGPRGLIQGYAYCHTQAVGIILRHYLVARLDDTSLLGIIYGSKGVPMLHVYDLPRLDDAWLL